MTKTRAGIVNPVNQANMALPRIVGIWSPDGDPENFIGRERMGALSIYRHRLDQTAKYSFAVEMSGGKLGAYIPQQF